MMPLTHICKALIAEDIARDGTIEPRDCKVFDKALAYLFYGRPAYRTKGDGAIKLPAACPVCFVFDPDVINQADEIHPFDTGAFEARLYKHVMMDEMAVEDFSLEQASRRPNRLIHALYGTRAAYFDGDTHQLKEDVVASSEFLGTAYVELLTSKGRNEPDDRVGTIEIITSKSIKIAGNLKSIVVPDIIWSDKDRADWLSELEKDGVDIVPFRYLHGREPEHHHSLIEIALRQFLFDNDHL
ncbi:hypothetical protein [Caulobacter radicis]|uniref:hypothetical protein n=1 Tax=Caulobacter radicis TaxID=2172650 RepID=UPI0010580C98|nr:hypothetical protein [Caulobacter radicis]